MKLKEERIEDLYTMYCESRIDGTEKICIVCHLEGTHCEGLECENSYNKFLEQDKFKQVIKELRKDEYLRNKYNSFSITQKLRFKKYINN